VALAPLTRHLVKGPSRSRPRVRPGDAEKARKAAEQAESEKTDLRAKLLAQLNTILQTRDSAAA